MKAGTPQDNDNTNPSLTDSSLDTIGNSGPVSWEVAVPNGTYYVKLVAGDPNYTSGTYKYGVENDNTFLDGTAAAGAQWITAAKTVTVSDGRLTIRNISGASRHAIAYVEITDAAAKMRNGVEVPSDVVATAAGSTKVDVRWTDASDNETGFRVDRAASASGPWTQVGIVPANAGVFTDTVTPSGTYYYRVGAMKGALLAHQASNAVTTPAGNGQMPYNAARTAWPTETTIQAEDFDAGGDQISYDDLINGNAGGYYRNGNVDVGYDIPNKRYFVGWTRHSEWMEYTVNVPVTGTYVLEANVASDQDGGSLGIAVNGAGTGAVVDIPATGSFTNYQQVDSQPIQLTAGTNQVLRLTAIDNGSSSYALGDVDWLNLRRVQSGTITLTATAPNDTEVNLAWNDPSDHETGYQIEKSTNGVTFSPVLTTPPNATGWSLKGLSPGTHYWFRVRSVVPAGGSVDLSNTADTTTLTATQAGNSWEDLDTVYTLNQQTDSPPPPIKWFAAPISNQYQYRVKYVSGAFSFVAASSYWTAQSQFVDNATPSSTLAFLQHIDWYTSSPTLVQSEIETSGGLHSQPVTTNASQLGVRLFDPVYTDNGPSTERTYWQLQRRPLNATGDDPPTVSIAATDAEAWESPSAAGQDDALTFTVTHAGGNVNDPLDVALHPAAGTATAADYSAGIPSSVHFNGGQTTATVTVYANADNVAEGDETLAICLKASPLYRLASSSSAEGIIHNYGGGVNPGITPAVTDIWMDIDASNLTVFWFAKNGEIYDIYRDSNENFIPSAANLVASTTYGLFVDPTIFTSGANATYKILTEKGSAILGELRMLTVVNGEDKSLLLTQVGGQTSYPMDSTTSAIAGSSLLTPSQWLQASYQGAGIDPSKWDANFGYTNTPSHPDIDYTKDVYEDYQQLNQNSNIYATEIRPLIWAGMARLAGGPIVRGFEASLTAPYLAALVASLSPLPPGTITTFGIAKALARHIQGIFIHVQQSIFADLAWQQEAYLNGGIAEINGLAAAGQIVPEIATVW